ncbi:TPA: single-stranded DNA-binding protein, partial [Enterococcus faecium]|nr:single-stranded DNA-binding protein [Enterococcus faecium]
MKLSESIDEIVKGLVKFRRQLVQPKKDANNPFFKSKYVTLDGVIKAIDDALEGTGITYTQEATSEGNFVSVATYILHESGQYLLFEPLTVPTTKADAQAFGS